MDITLTSTKEGILSQDDALLQGTATAPPTHSSHPSVSHPSHSVSHSVSPTYTKTPTTTTPTAYTCQFQVCNNLPWMTPYPTKADLARHLLLHRCQWTCMESSVQVVRVSDGGEMGGGGIVSDHYPPHSNTTHHPTQHPYPSQHPYPYPYPTHQLEHTHPPPPGQLRWRHCNYIPEHEEALREHLEMHLQSDIPSL